MTEHLITEEHIETYQRDGVVLLKGIARDWVDTLREGVENNLANPGPYAAENLLEGEQGRFFDDYCNWSRIEAFENVIRHSTLKDAAAALMQSTRVQLFHEHVLVKEPGTSKPTPWHQDSPYYFINGQQNVSFWIPLDSVQDASLRCVPGSHRWQKPVLPIKWLSEENFYQDSANYQAIPDPDESNYDVKEWPMQAGDAVAFHFSTLHGARGNTSQSRRRAFSLRLVGDDATYIDRGEKTSPPFPGHGMSNGEQLRTDWFPILRG